MEKDGKLRQFLQDKVRSASLFYILICLFTSVFVFVLIWDKSPEVNDQIPRISLKNPGFEVTLLKVKRTMDPNRFSLKSLFLGRNSEFEHIPLQDYSIEGDSLIYTLYEGESTAPLPKNAFHLAALTVVPTEIQNIKKFDDRFVVEMVNGKKYNVNIAKLSEDILDQQIEQRTFIFGTDLFGRSILDRALLGIRYSLFIGLLAVFISITLGTLIGVIAGYFGGKVDDLLSYIMNVFWSIPTLVLVFAIVLVMGRGIQNIFIAVGLTMWVDAARLARGQVMSVKREKYVEAAKTTGMSTYRIIFRHILPNMLGPLFVIATSNFASAIIIESGLSYLGFGIQPPAPSLGSIISENYGYLMTGKPMLAVIPVLLLLSLVLAFNLVGNGIRDIFDVRSELS